MHALISSIYESHSHSSSTVISSPKNMCRSSMSISPSWSRSILCVTDQRQTHSLKISSAYSRRMPSLRAKQAARNSE